MRYFGFAERSGDHRRDLAATVAERTYVPGNDELLLRGGPSGLGSKVEL